MFCEIHVLFFIYEPKVLYMKPSGTNVHTCVPKHFGAQACLPTRQAQKDMKKHACMPKGITACRPVCPVCRQAGIRVPWYQKVRV
jgi:hypothetical protein